MFGGGGGWRKRWEFIERKNENLYKNARERGMYCERKFMIAKV